MEYTFYDFLALLGSLALFLYGMKIMSEGLQKFAGDRLRSILTAMTTNRVTGVLTGVLITALIHIKGVGTMRKLNEEKLEKLPTFNQQLADEETSSIRLMMPSFTLSSTTLSLLILR